MHTNDIDWNYEYRQEQKEAGSTNCLMSKFAEDYWGFWLILCKPEASTGNMIIMTTIIK